MSRKSALVCGAGGFIGGHLVKRLIKEDYKVLAVDIKNINNWFQVFSGVSCSTFDLSKKSLCNIIVSSQIDEIYQLAADMGGIGYITKNKANCMLSSLITTHMLLAAKEYNVKRFFYSSSACIYPFSKQNNPNAAPLKESDAYPADCEDGYGWEKLFSERMCKSFYEDYGLETRVLRFFNCFGEHGEYNGGREKAPAAICRKVAIAKLTGKYGIEIWGDGNQTRSFMYVDDCVEGILKFTQSDYHEPVNIGSTELVTINQLVDYVEEIAGIKLDRHYILDAPRGVVGRNSDNSLLKKITGFEPSISLKKGLEKNYKWIYNKVKSQYDGYRS